MLPIFKVLLSAPERVKELLTVSVLEPSVSVPVPAVIVFPLYVPATIFPPSVRLPLLVSELALLKKLIFPVLLFPIVNVWLFVVPITPALLSVIFPEMDAMQLEFLMHY